MSIPVEARSLSDLNYLLANPPQYPRNPTHDVHKPVVLYIVRVPGSKDVFLTPLKPATKASITLEAVQYCLYYLHVNGPEDEDVRDSVEEEQVEARRAENVPPLIHRKPLPTVPHENYPPSQRPAPPPKSYPQYQPSADGRTDASQLERYVARGSAVHFDAGNGASTSAGAVTRKPVGPRPFHSLAAVREAAHTDRQSTRFDPDNGYDIARQRFSGHEGDILPLEHQPGTRRDQLPPTWDQEPTRTSTSSRPSHELTNRFSWIQPSDQALSITIIRRDPTSGAQWNVGVINIGATPSELALCPVSIELGTPGYFKFNGLQEVSIPKDPMDADAVKRAIANAESDSATAITATEEIFTRSVEFRQLSSPGLPIRLPARTNSMNRVPNFPIQDRPPKSVFSFLSPWQGLCSFSNGIDGRSLRCRHTVSSSMLDDEQSTVNVAELRFNLARSAPTFLKDESRRSTTEDGEPDTLPISQLLKEPHRGKTAIRKGLRHIKNFSRDIKGSGASEHERVHVRPNVYHSDVSTRYHSSDQMGLEDVGLVERDPNRLSLRLGREKAGGGYRGNSAKLGKLIIEDEGLKMGDLVVAACMGVWWQHYDRQEV